MILHCSDEHPHIKELDIIAGQLKFILDACKDVDCLNYGSRIGHIETAALNSIASIERIINKDVEEKQKEEANA